MARMETFDRLPEVVLAVYAHPDDADVACGASLARWVDQGADVHLVLVARGEKGTIDPDVDPDDLAVLRKSEVAAAAEILRVTSLVQLDIPDGEVPEQPWLMERLVGLIRSLKPDLVIGHDPTAVFFGSVYVNHRDHRATGWALLDAVAPASGLPHYFPDSGPAHKVRDVLLSGTLEPDTFVDVSSHVDRKVGAVAAHRSQLSGDPDWVAQSVRQRAADDGRLIGARAAEGFRHIELDG